MPKDAETIGLYKQFPRSGEFSGSHGGEYEDDHLPPDYKPQHPRRQSCPISFASFSIPDIGVLFVQ
jgi:hypothetical protein